MNLENLANKIGKVAILILILNVLLLVFMHGLFYLNLKPPTESAYLIFLFPLLLFVAGLNNIVLGIYAILNKKIY